MATILGRTVMPADALSWLRPDALPTAAVESFRNNVRAAKLGLPMWMDRWDGYPAARSRLLRAAQPADADLVMLSGDSHNAWAYALVEDGRPAGVEFAGHSGHLGRRSRTSFGVDPKTVAAQASWPPTPSSKWADTSQRGYLMIERHAAAGHRRVAVPADDQDAPTPP